MLELPSIPESKGEAKSGNGLKFLGIAALLVSVANLLEDSDSLIHNVLLQSAIPQQLA